MAEYVWNEYPFSGIVPSFQAELYDEEEHIDRAALQTACARTEKNATLVDLSTPKRIEQFARMADGFDVRLIGLLNEWSSATNQTYARDGLRIDGKSASQLMWEQGMSFVDVVVTAQNAFFLADGTVEPTAQQGGAGLKPEQVSSVEISIGGPDFQSGENVLETVRERGQLKNTPETSAARRLLSRFGGNQAAESLARDRRTAEQLADCVPKEATRTERQEENRKQLLEERKDMTEQRSSQRERISFEAIQLQGKETRVPKKPMGTTNEAAKERDSGLGKGK